MVKVFVSIELKIEYRANMNVFRGEVLSLAFLDTNLSKEVRRRAEKLMSSYKNIGAIIESRKLDLEPKLTTGGQVNESQRGNQFHSQTESLALVRLEIEEYNITKKKLDIIYESLKPNQQDIWDQRYLLDRNDVDVYTDLNIHYRTYYRLKKEMIAIVADGFGLFNG